MSPLRTEVGPRAAGMAGRAPALPAPLTLTVGSAAVLLAVVAGVAFAVDARAGTALVLALVYAALALTNLSLAIALWVPLIFLAAIPAFNLGAEAAGAMLAVAWVGTIRLAGTADAVAAVIGESRRTFVALALLLVWLSMSLLWAENPGRVLEDIWHWYALAVLFVVISTTVRSERIIKLCLAGFLVGSLLSVLYGLLISNSLIAPGETAVRLEGAGGDPNSLAAGIVAAIVLAGALATTTRQAPIRAALVGVILVLVAGLVASESRGGAIAALLTMIVAFVVFRRGRVYVATFALLVVGAAMMWFSTTPGAWERVTTFDAGGSGRSALWTGAWRAAEDYPVAGVGLNNFRDVAPDYAREPGSLESVRILAERPRFVHNLYLQLLAENGIIGLLLFLGFALGCLRATWLGARRFEILRRTSLETLSRAVLVATISILVTAFFLSGALDRGMWILFALGPALLGIAGRLPQSPQAPAPS